MEALTKFFEYIRFLIHPRSYLSFNVPESVLWIRFRIHFDGLDPDPGGQKWSTKIEKSEEKNVII
jgi:hypothetical protein